MKKILKIFNPFIWVCNVVNYMAHLEGFRGLNCYDKYNFSKDLKYF